MKTPLQELIDTIKERKGNENSMPFMWNGDIIKLAESLLEKEKQQIIEAYHQGVTDEYGDALEFGNDTDGEVYYNEIYGKR
jgi:hypothetical protein